MKEALKAEAYLLALLLSFISAGNVLAQMSTYPGSNSSGNNAGQNSYGSYNSSPTSQYSANTPRNDHGLGADASKASDERAEYSRFRNQASEYQMEIQKRLEYINNDEETEKKKEEELEQKIKHVQPVERGKLLGQIEACRRELEKDESEKKTANLYLYRTYQWLNYEKGQVDNAEYNVAEDQEMTREDAAKARQAEAQRAWEAQKLANAQYWQQVNNPSNYGYGGGCGSGYGYRNGRFRGYGYQPYTGHFSFHSSYHGHH